MVYSNNFKSLKLYKQYLNSIKLIKLMTRTQCERYYTMQRVNWYHHFQFYFRKTNDKLIEK